MPPPHARFVSRSSAALLVLDADARVSQAPAAAEAAGTGECRDASSVRPPTTKRAVLARTGHVRPRRGAAVPGLRDAALLLAASFGLSFAVIYACLTLLQNVAALLPH